MKNSNAIVIFISKKNKYIAVLFMLLLISFRMHSTHIVGGELNYKCLGGNQYQIKLRIYRDCYTGQAPFDSSAAVGIFDVNNVLVTTAYLKFPGSTVLPQTVAQTDKCVQFPSSICVEVAQYVGTITLAPRAGGYQLAYQRCCRNPTISNIVNPGNQGATYYARIPDQATACNSNPEFKNWPPMFVCANNQIVFDHAATDADGDAIVYSLCSPLTGATTNAPQPQPPTAPPYNPVTWKAPYSPTNPFGGLNPLTIDPKTGIMTGIPTTLGQYVVGVCADEYRNGTLISTTKRDFQFNVINCQPDVDALTPTINVDCKTRTVTFTNNSIGTNNFFWNFGDPNVTTDTSRLKNPTYTYPSVGTYSVTLIAFSGINSKCNDTLRNILVKVDLCPCNMTLGLSKLDAYCDNPYSGCTHVTGSKSGVNSYSIDNYGSAAPPPTGGICGSGGSSNLLLTANTTPDSIRIKINGVILPPPTSPAQTIIFTGQTQAACPNTANINCDGAGVATYDYYIWTPSGSTPGSATVTPAGGIGPYTYLWTPGGKTTATAGNLSTGSYTVTVTDVANNCQKTASVRIDDGSSMTLITTPTALSSCSATDAKATVTVSPTVNGPFTFLWSNGQTTNPAVNLPKGTYTVIVRNRFGCESSDSVTISQPLTINAGISKTDAKCKGNNGTATSNPSGGAGPYTYSWNTNPVQTGKTATGLTAGTYSVTVTDAGGCTGTGSVSIADKSLVMTSSSANIICGGDGNGTASMSATGGTPAYTYLWNSNPVQTTAKAVGLPGGTYIGKLVDAAGCSDSVKITITEPVRLSAEPSNTSTRSCAGVPTGSAHTDVSGGTPGYTYNWNPGGKSTQDITGMPEGNYTVTVSDSKGCTATNSISITYPLLLSINTSINGTVACSGNKTGAITASPMGGIPGYDYLWSTMPAQTTQSANNLGAGTYTVTVTDSKGCTSSATATINEPPPLSLSTKSESVGCVTSDGTAGVTASGGTGLFTYAWSPTGKTTATITGLSARTYTVTVTDANGCSKGTSVVVINATPPTSGISSQLNVLCKGAATGSATVSASGGTPAYSYSWAPGGQTTATVNGLSAGTYSVTITDMKGCSRQQIITITQPTSALSITASSTPAICGNNNGTVSVNASGGTVPLFYSWTTPNNDTSPTVTGLTAGTYTVTVTDNNNCLQTATARVNNLPGPSLVVVSKTNISCYGKIDGKATVTVSGGTGPFNYSWNPIGGSGSNENGLSAGTYTVTVSDSSGCKDTVFIPITEPLPITFTLSLSGPACSGGSVTILIDTKGGTPPYSYNWLPSGPVVSPVNPTTYSVAVTDNNGCKTTQNNTITVTPLPSPIAGFDTLSSGRYGQTFTFTDLSIGGTTWYWDFGDGKNSLFSNPIHTYPGAGVYTVTQIVTAVSGCADTITKLLTVYPNILIPNVFTPNGDGSNDEFWIPSSGFEYFDLGIYNRWGLKIFTSDTGEIRWNGRTASGELVPDGVYYYLLKAKLKTAEGGKDYHVQGFIHLYTSGVE